MIINESDASSTHYNARAGCKPVGRRRDVGRYRMYIIIFRKKRPSMSYDSSEYNIISNNENELNTRRNIPLLHKTRFT